MAKTIRALILGDIIGQPGCRALFVNLKNLIRQEKADVVVINGENSADGYGITPEIADSLFGLGAHVITTGNHVWQRKEIFPYFDARSELLRPANYPEAAPGAGLCIVDIAGTPVAVINLQGRVRLANIDCPFSTAKKLLKKLPSEIKVVIVDFHAEATEEKEALGLYLDGKVSVVAGTHTHVPTADLKVLPKGTAYITDLGMIGPTASVIGMDPDTAVRRSISQMPLKLAIVDSPAVINGISVEIDPDSGKAVAAHRISVDRQL